MSPQPVTSLLAVLTITMTALFNSDPPKLGSEADPIRQGLFACQPMGVLVQRLKLDGSPGPFQTFADAAALAREGKKEDAKSRLHSILAIPNLETRIQLWVWSALRELGEQPDAKSGKEVLGVVIEVPMRGEYDTLAGYQDGSARYLNFSGKAIFWDKPDGSIKLLCERLITSTVPEGSRAVLRKDTVLPKSGTQITLLTRSGMYVIANPSQSAMTAGSALMLELMKRAKETAANKPD
jgi:hypothetical protein